MNTPNLLDAIRIVKENEKSARDSYANAAKKVNPLGKKLFEQLSEFEQFHYDKLTALEKSLEDSGKFINYEGKALICHPGSKLSSLKQRSIKALMEIISEARKLETTQKKYTPTWPTSWMTHRAMICLSRLQKKSTNII